MKVILIGHGGFGSLYRQRIMESNRMTLVGVVDFDPSRLPTGPFITALTASAAFSRVTADAVVIATNPDSHAQLAMRSLDAGMHVFCAKPGALGSAEAKLIHRHAVRAAKAFYVDYTMLSSPESYALGQQLNMLGEPRMMIVTRRSTGRERGEGMLHDLACHDLACFYAYCAYEDVRGVTCQRSEKAMLIELFNETRVVARINVACGSDEARRNVSFSLTPRLPLRADEAHLHWNQLDRTLTAALTKDGRTSKLVMEFVDNPDPVSLSMNSFVNAANSPYLNRYSIDQHAWVTMITHRLEQSIQLGGDKVSV